MMGQPVTASAFLYLSGLVLGAATSYFPILSLLLMILGGCFSVYGYWKWKWLLKKVILSWGLILLGVVNLQVSTPTELVDDLSHSLMTGDPVTVQGRIDTPPQHRPDPYDKGESTVLFIKIKTVLIGNQEQSVRGRLRLTIHRFDPEVEYGDEVAVTARLKPISSFRNPGGFDYAAYLRQQGFRVRATIHQPEAIKVVRTSSWSALKKIYHWREEIRLAMMRSLSPQAAAILQAMIIGESGFLTPPIRESFMASGMTHILSISGSHLSLVALVVFMSSLWFIRHLPSGLFLRVGRVMHPKQLAAAVTIPPVVFYALLAGGQIATIRALIMILIYLGSLWLVRRHDPLNALALAVLVVTVTTPRSIFDISFQFSYMAVLAMILIVKAKEALPSKVMRFRTIWIGAQKTVLMTIVAGLSTAPLVAFHFNLFNWVGLISNLIVTPLVGILVVPLGLFSALLVIGTHGSDFPMAALHNAVIALLMVVVEGFARLPWAEFYVPSPPVIVIALWYAAAWLVFLSAADHRKRVVGAMLCLICTLPWFIGLENLKQDRKLRVTFLDVGQGDAALIRFPEGKTMLIDGGVRYGNFDVGRFVIGPYLRDQSIDEIDYLVLTHPQIDHAGGLIHILQKFKVREIWTNGVSKDAAFFKDFLRVANAQGVSITTVNAESPDINIDGTTVMILHPGNRSGELKDNDRSVVIKIQYGKYSILFTGDIEARAENKLLRWGDLLGSFMIKVPHHGSRSSIEPAFLVRVCPRIAVISVGAQNSYGHPSQETLVAYQLLGSRIYRTDQDGAIMVVTDGKHWRVRTYEDFSLTPVRWARGIILQEWGNWRKVIQRWVGAEPA